MRDTDLRDIYTGPSFRLRRTHYDDGGDVSYIGNYNPSTGVTDPTSLSPGGYEPVATPGGGAYDPNTGLYVDAKGNQTDMQPGMTPRTLPGGAYFNPGATYGSSGTDSGSSGQGGKTLSQSIQGMLKGLGMPSGAASTLTNLAPLLPFIYALTGGNKQPKAPGLPSQYSGTPMNITPPSYTRQTNPYYSAGPGGGPSGAGMTMKDWLHAAEQPGGMPQFYTNNMLPATPNSAPDQQALWALGQQMGAPPPTGSAPTMPTPRLPIGRPGFPPGRAHGGPIHFDVGGMMPMQNQAAMQGAGNLGMMGATTGGGNMGWLQGGPMAGPGTTTPTYATPPPMPSWVANDPKMASWWNSPQANLVGNWSAGFGFNPNPPPAASGPPGGQGLAGMFGQLGGPGGGGGAQPPGGGMTVGNLPAGYTPPTLGGITGPAATGINPGYTNPTTGISMPPTYAFGPQPGSQFTPPSQPPMTNAGGVGGMMGGASPTGAPPPPPPPGAGLFGGAGMMGGFAGPPPTGVARPGQLNTFQQLMQQMRGPSGASGVAVPPPARTPAMPQRPPLQRPNMGFERPGMARMGYRAKGGYMGHSGYGTALGHAGPGFAQGPGDGTSDDINAKLSDGEYVIDAPTVSLLGNGSNSAGAKKLDQMRVNARKHAGKKLARGKQPMSARAPEQYMTGAGYV